MKQILVRTDRCLGCKTCELACNVAHTAGKELFTAVLTNQRPVKRVKVESNYDRTLNLPVQCRQCSEPKCVSACMTGAMHRDVETGLVLNNEAKCVGCWMCVMVCPFGVIVPSEEQKVATKCDQCHSENNDPACVKSCPTKALQFQEIEDFNKGLQRKFLTTFIPGGEA